ncbi:MAG: coenzyme F420-0:L-glutamate ligase/coenzyme F420-1:gamma-L-glutamate ligase [Paracoccaceae bacterium]|jgi:coenzyme F420-0:L-glutamate ligase/coenzyme F420-1:gamma-L-glutamate ligase
MSAPARRLRLFAPDTVPEITAGSDLAGIFLKAVNALGETPNDGDIVVFAQKIVSKAEGQTIALKNVLPGTEAQALAAETGKDPRIVELILQESSEIVRKRDGLIIARHRNGCVAANACIDLSNAGGDEIAVLLPVDADQSAKSIVEDVLAKSGIRVAVIINDSLGRAWRMGTTGTAIGTFGLTALQDRRGAPDRGGEVLQSSEIAIADEAAAAASLLMGQGDEGLPIVVIRGLDWAAGTGTATDLVRPPEFDLFR